MTQDAINFIKSYFADQALSLVDQDVEICKLIVLIQDAFDEYCREQYEESVRLRKLGFYTFEEWTRIENEKDKYLNES